MLYGGRSSSATSNASCTSAWFKARPPPVSSAASSRAPARRRSASYPGHARARARGRARSIDRHPPLHIPQLLRLALGERHHPADHTLLDQPRRTMPNRTVRQWDHVRCARRRAVATDVAPSVVGAPDAGAHSGAASPRPRSGAGTRRRVVPPSAHVYPRGEWARARRSGLGEAQRPAERYRWRLVARREGTLAGSLGQHAAREVAAEGETPGLAARPGSPGSSPPGEREGGLAPRA